MQMTQTSTRPPQPVAKHGRSVSRVFDGRCSFARHGSDLSSAPGLSALERADAGHGLESFGAILSNCLHRGGRLHHREARASQSNASRLGTGRYRIRHGHGRCDRHDSDAPWPTLVSDRDCGHGRALHLARRSSTSQMAFLTMIWRMLLLSRAFPVPGDSRLGRRHSSWRGSDSTMAEVWD
jgi:hypothetical protein